MDTKTANLLEELFEKYRLSGQNTNDYLEGLLVSNYEPYWKYILLDSLLSLQNPKTDFKDETIFITYHQITELYFKLILHEMDQVHDAPEDVTRFELCLVRINRYMRNLIYSFDIMIDGMKHEDFLKFRMALLPASGFQSGQFRLIEFCTTDLENLVAANDREALLNSDISTLYESVYWKKGAIDLDTGEKTLTLRQFEQHYDPIFKAHIKKCEKLNLNQLFLRFVAAGKVSEKMRNQLRELDVNLNVNWRLSHYRAAVRYLQRSGGDVAATGGTNWQKFLPPRFQRIYAFPDLWNEQEKTEWGKSWVMEQLTS